MAEGNGIAIAPAFRLPSSDGLRRGAALAISRGGAVAAQMAVQVAVGAVAGPAGIGLLQLHMSWSNLAGELVGAGEASRTLRDVSVRSGTGHRRRILSQLRQALLRVAVFASLLALAATLIAHVLSAEPAPTGRLLLYAVLLAAPLFAGVRIIAEALKALGDPVAAVTLENLLVPVVLLTLCGSIAAGWLGPAPVTLLGGVVLGLGLALLLLGRRLWQLLHRSVPAAPAGKAAPLPVGRFEQHFLWLNGLLNIAFLQLPFLLLPWFVDAAQIGRFAVAHKLVNIITTLLILLAALYGPRFARAAAAGDRARLRQLLTETQRLSLALFLPAWLVLVAAAQPLATLFSLGPGSLFSLLLLLGLGQLANAATGLSGVLLSMSGGAAAEFRILAFSTAATAMAASIAARYSGLEATALFVAGGIALRNGLAFAAAHRHIRTLTETSA